jgi:hypothetical protein
MARLYSNENFPLPAVEELRRLGHDVLTVAETGKAEQRWPDESVLEFAVSEARCVLTINRRDFIRLHKGHPQHAGIIVCTFDNDFIALASRIARAIAESGSLTDKLLRINRPTDLPRVPSVAE